MKTRRRRQESTNVRRQSNEDKEGEDAKVRTYEGKIVSTRRRRRESTNVRRQSHTLGRDVCTFFDNVTIVRGSKQHLHIYTLCIGSSGTKHRKYKCIVERDG